MYLKNTEPHHIRKPRLLELVPAIAFTLQLLVSLNIHAQDSAVSFGRSIPPNKALPPLSQVRELATFKLENGNEIFFGASKTDDLVYIEFGREGTDVAFPLDGQLTLLERYLALTPYGTSVPQPLVAQDADGQIKIDNREVVEATPPIHVDFPMGGNGAPDWGCGTNNTKANFENQFCDLDFAGDDLAFYCHSKKWTKHKLQLKRKRMQTFTAYCGDSNSLGFGASIFHSEWINSEWEVQKVTLLPNNDADWVYMDSYSSSPKWRQAFRAVYDTLVDGEWKPMGSFRALTVFNN